MGYLKDRFMATSTGGAARRVAMSMAERAARKYKMRLFRDYRLNFALGG